MSVSGISILGYRDSVGMIYIKPDMEVEYSMAMEKMLSKWKGIRRMFGRIVESSMARDCLHLLICA